MTLLRDWNPLDYEAYRQMCRHAEMNPIHAAACTGLESDFRCDARNPRSSATGLPQLMADRKTGLYLGRYTRAEIVRLGIAGQIPILAERYRKRAGRLGTLGRVYAIYAAPAAIDDALEDDEPIYDGAYFPDGKLAHPLLDDDGNFVRHPKGHPRAGRLIFPDGAKVRPTRYGETDDAYYANPAWNQGGPVTLFTLGVCARVEAHSPRFFEFVEHLTGAPCPWVNVWSSAVRAELGLGSISRVKEFQASKGLKVDGEVGRKTAAALVLAFDAGSLA